MSEFEYIRSILVNLDPEGLLRMGAPTDEYDGEAKTIAYAIEQGIPITPQYVRDVWLCSFGTSSAPGTGFVLGMPHRPVFDEIAAAIAKRDKE